MRASNCGSEASEAQRQRRRARKERALLLEVCAYQGGGEEAPANWSLRLAAALTHALYSDCLGLCRSI